MSSKLNYVAVVSVTTSATFGNLGFFNDDEWEKERKRRPAIKAQILKVYEDVTGDKPESLPMPVVIAHIENVSRFTKPDPTFEKLLADWNRIEAYRREQDDEETLIGLLYG